MELSVFEAFPNAIISGVWEIGTCKRGSVVGNVFAKTADIDVIIDEGNSSTVNKIPETIKSDLLVYVKPLNIPTNKLVAGYMLHDRENDYFYEIVDAGVGKNQHTGVIEHVELKLVQTEVVDV